MQTINREELKKIMDREENMQVLNVLPEKIYNSEHIPGSINIPYDDTEHFVNNVRRIAPFKDANIIVHCAGGECSSSKKAEKDLRVAGYMNVRLYEGGMKDWKTAHMPLEGQDVTKAQYKKAS